VQADAVGERGHDGGASADVTGEGGILATVSSTLGLAATEHQWERNLQVVLDGMRTPAS